MFEFCYSTNILGDLKENEEWLGQDNLKAGWEKLSSNLSAWLKRGLFFFYCLPVHLILSCLLLQILSLLVYRYLSPKTKARSGGLSDLVFAVGVLLDAAWALKGPVLISLCKKWYFDGIELEPEYFVGMWYALVPGFNITHFTVTLRNNHLLWLFKILLRAKALRQYLILIITNYKDKQGIQMLLTFFFFFHISINRENEQNS